MGGEPGIVVNGEVVTVGEVLAGAKFAGDRAAYRKSGIYRREAPEGYFVAHRF